MQAEKKLLHQSNPVLQSKAKKNDLVIPGPLVFK
jgi:hypothetical protein